jgi:thiol-disulfide isomerase/thioredoxin
VAIFTIASGPGPAIDEWVGARAPAELVAVVLGAAALALLVAYFYLWRERGRLRAELTTRSRQPPALGLPVGALAPDFSARDLDGDIFTLNELRSRGRPVALVFGVPGCGPCSAIAPELPRWQEALASSLTIGLVGIGTYLRYEETAARTGSSLREVYLRDGELAQELDELNALLATYQVRATPSAVIVTPEGTIASVTVDGRPAIEALIHLAVARSGAVGLRASQAVAV